MHERSLRRAGIREDRLELGDVALSYAEGPEAGPPLLLIPAQALPWQSYVRVLPGLARRFHVLAVDVRGHGGSSRTPGAYTIEAIGRDFARFLERKVRAPAIVSGNSSGGLFALWLAARRPELVRGVVAEDAPIFSSELGRLRDCYVARVLESCVKHLGGAGGRDLAGLLGSLEVPVAGSQRVVSFPKLVRSGVAAGLGLYRWLRPSGPVDIPFLPPESRLLIWGLSDYDPDFSRAFLDGSACRGFDHAEALAAVRCPFLLLRARWFRHPTLGLVGSMDDRDVERAQALAPSLRFASIPAGHMIHLSDPARYLAALSAFAAECAPQSEKRASTTAEGTVSLPSARTPTS